MDNQNPYAAPLEMGLEPEPDNWEAPPPNPIAKGDERLLTLYVDGFIIGAMFVLCTILWGASDFPFVLTIVVTMGFAFAYYFSLEASFGKTIGKFFAGTRVLTFYGESPTSSHILKRTFARLIPLEILSFLGEQGHPIGLHDSLSDTVVVAENRWTGKCTWLPAEEPDGFSAVDGSELRDQVTRDPWPTRNA